MKNKKIHDIIMLHGSDIIKSNNINIQKSNYQHGKVSVYEHSLKVAYLSILISKKLHIKLNYRSLVRGALLHDYFLYDWHTKDKSNRLHGFTHAKRALKNAEKEFSLNPIERDIIIRHMFPLNIKPPKYRESIIVCIADKISATLETLFLRKEY